MPAKHSRHIALTKTLAAWIDSRVAKGEYASSSDLIRAAIRALQIQDEGKVDVQAAVMPTQPGRERS